MFVCVVVVSIEFVYLLCMILLFYIGLLCFVRALFHVFGDGLSECPPGS